MPSRNVQGECLGEISREECPTGMSRGECLAGISMGKRPGKRPENNVQEECPRENVQGMSRETSREEYPGRMSTEKRPGECPGKRPENNIQGECPRKKNVQGNVQGKRPEKNVQRECPRENV